MGYKQVSIFGHLHRYPHYVADVILGYVLNKKSYENEDSAWLIIPTYTASLVRKAIFCTTYDEFISSKVSSIVEQSPFWVKIQTSGFHCVYEVTG